MKTAGISPAETRIGLNPQEKRHDPYAARWKPHGPSRCTQCGAVFADGRWCWQKDAPEKLASVICPACHRVNDRYPAGQITLDGEFLKQHGQEILNMLHNEADIENREHPLNRILAVSEEPGRIVITTTDIHLPLRFMHAVERSHKGQTGIQFDEEGYFARATWHRDE